MENYDERMTDYLEQYIPEMAQAAVSIAYWQALASGSSVLVGENDVINEVFPDGTIRFVKNISPPVKTEKGKIIKIK